MKSNVKRDYDASASTYGSLEEIPNGILEDDLIITALGSCTGKRVIDIGGGSGLHARQAIAAGATCVDVVDLSPEMLAIGKSISAQHEHSDRIRWYLADVSQPLNHISDLEPGSYDIVMANWVFDHASSLAMLEGMWRNISHYVKPGGQFIGVRVANPRAKCVQNGQYGITFEDPVDFEEGGKGVRYQLVAHVEPKVTFEASSMEVSCFGSTELHQKFGFGNVEMMKAEESETVRRDPEYWNSFLEDPNFAVVTARKL